MPTRLPRFGLLFSVVLVASGCALFRPPKADIDVTQLQAAFPAVEAIGAIVYMDEGGDPACEYFEYERGAFTSNPADEFCRVFERIDEPGQDGPPPVAFDEQARADLKTLLAAFKNTGAGLRYMNVALDADGSVESESTFAFDRCVYYRYHPGWADLPQDTPGEEVWAGVNGDWYQNDNCP
jgi:hypothetical protein